MPNHTPKNTGPPHIECCCALPLDKTRERAMGAQDADSAPQRTSRRSVRVKPRILLPDPEPVADQKPQPAPVDVATGGNDSAPKERVKRLDGRGRLVRGKSKKRKVTVLGDALVLVHCHRGCGETWETPPLSVDRVRWHKTIRCANAHESQRCPLRPGQHRRKSTKKYRRRRPKQQRKQPRHTLELHPDGPMATLLMAVVQQLPVQTQTTNSSCGSDGEVPSQPTSSSSDEAGRDSPQFYV